MAAALTHQRLLEALHYDAVSGVFTWRIRGAHRRKPGDVAGSPSKDGRIRLRLDGQLYYRYRLAWFYMTGEWPSRHIDHRNGNAVDDRWANLRDVSQAVNMQNRQGPQRNSSTGLLGAYRKRGKFVSVITIDKRQRHLGTFPTAETAHAAYMAARREHLPGNTL